MTTQFENRLAALSRHDNLKLLGFIRRGIEKESLRIAADGKLAQTPHPRALGSALTHPCITTDYSEALLEFITQPHQQLTDTLRELDEIHRFVYPHIGDELLWPASMPCVLEDDAHIPVAYYGTSNVGRMKSVYRIGLGHRYGRLMQTIAGVHYNFSLGDEFWEWLRDEVGNGHSLRDFKTEQYFRLIRNFHRFSWLLVYLFGASPAVCQSFVAGRNHALLPLTRGTLHLPHATSLRMGDLGYQSNAQSNIDIPYNGLDDYVCALHRAVTQPHPAYVDIGVQRGDEWLQLNTSLLQIENEFYSSIRPKRVTHSGESPRHALRERGVEYIEVRCLDLDPFEPIGIGLATARFVDAFLVFCLLSDSPLSDTTSRRINHDNLRQVVMRGREPGLRLSRGNGSDGLLQDWAGELLRDIETIGGLLDSVHGTTEYGDSIGAQRKKIETPALTPSARVLQEITSRDISFYRFVRETAQNQRAHFLEHPVSTERLAEYTALTQASLDEQRNIETKDRISFAEYVSSYFMQ